MELCEFSNIDNSGLFLVILAIFLNFQNSD